MTIAEKIAWDDSLLPFQLDAADIRGRFVRLDGALNKILDQHDYPAPVAKLVAEAVVLTALIGQTIGFKAKLSLQIRGNGPIRLIATDYFAPIAEGEAGKVRAYASFDEARLSKNLPFSQLGKGMFAVLIDQGTGQAPYQGITPLDAGSLASCAETYFTRSEQLPTRFALSIAAGKSWRAAGLVLQHMPKASPLKVMAEPTDEKADAENWNRATILLESVQKDEMIGPKVSPAELLFRLFHEDVPRVYDPQPVRFGCTCSEEKVRQSMSIYSAKDIATMTTEAGTLTADCQFCGAHYVLDPETLGKDAGSGRSAK
ncbi:MAG: Hsp33 family molecular chaperone HslO [Rhodobacteraceae bacterium]|nr:Hsp33 family molecular chaperone HslO [Paracoccaceae bacterium]